MTQIKYLDKDGLSTVWSKVKGIVTPKADKVSGATNGHLAGLNSSGNLTDSGLAASNIAQKDGSYSGMTVGAAEDLVSAESVASEFTSRITGGSTAVGKGGTALVDKIKGRTLVWNQLVLPYTNNTVTVNQVAITIEADGKYVFSGTSSGSGGRTTYVSSSTIRVPIISGHRYLSLNQAPDTLSPFITNPSSTSTMMGATKDAIVTAGSSFMGRLGFNLQSNVDYTGVSFYLSLIDLTLMFGAGNEPSTVAEFEALYPGPYYDYNPGTLISNAATAIETVGFNQWDEEWEVGGFNTSTGEKVSSFSNRIRSVNYVPVFGNATYYIKTSNPLLLFFYDSNKVFISPYISVPNTGVTVTTPSNAKYLRFSTSGNPSITSYNNDICISLPDPSRNGTYEPYWRSELELGLGDIKVKSHNIWDEEWELGTYDSNGEKSAANDRIRSANYIAVSPNTSYYFKLYASSNVICWYDSSYNFISRVSSSANDVRTSPANAAYCTFFCGAGYGNTYNNDICINLSDPAFNGRYEPYGDGGVISITGGLKSAGTVYDEISGGKLVKRIESVDLGSLTWTYSSGIFLTSGLRGYVEEPADASDMSNIVCAKYPASAYVGGGSTADKVAYIIFQTSSSHGYLYIRDSAYTDATTFTAAMAGVPLYYELAQPIEYELAEAIPTAMRNDPYGTERRLPEDTAAIVTAPFRADITYSTNIKEAVQSLPQNYININSMQDFLAALGAQMGGTWTMRQADGKFDFTFTPNPSND